MAERQYVTFKEAAEEYGVSVSCLRRAIKSETNPLPYYCPNGQQRGWRLRRDEVAAWLEGWRVTGPSSANAQKRN